MLRQAMDEDIEGEEMEKTNPALLCSNQHSREDIGRNYIHYN